MIKITPIDAEQTLRIRQQVLWPAYSQDFCRVAEDQSGQHFGAWLDGQLIMVASLFIQQDSIRLRKFACLPAFQGRGYGSAMLKHLLHLQQATSLKCFWFDARCSAIDFYQGLGFSVDSAVFEKHGVEYVKMSRQLQR
ncbi:GNAT family N-acetyltransferase [Agarivorans sp. MS3-6]|uniref:GNAT family N-acetyltransferase n=1 Tax=Agarivorans sp. TSD2052 TaxID=2937286 RepID=UPI00200C81E4|nr:GNAT family N-acetyltransferase [Agarivorans sp. TSD2052]UPW18540.1 GNAT family N-acetyltransferase [Agarivorans sp. TSD2052]